MNHPLLKELKGNLSAEQYLAVVEHMGGEPQNPVGTCFDSSIMQFLLAEDAEEFPQRKLCHGIGVANLPGQEGKEIIHAWIEIDGTALDTTWAVSATAEKYRSEFKLRLVVEYTPAEANALWKQTDMPGPWDDRIRAVSI